MAGMGSSDMKEDGGHQAVQADAVTTVHAGWRLRETSMLQLQAALGKQVSPRLFWGGPMDMRESLPRSRGLQGLVKLQAQGRSTRPGFVFVKPGVPGIGRAV